MSVACSMSLVISLEMSRRAVNLPGGTQFPNKQANRRDPVKNTFARMFSHRDVMRNARGARRSALALAILITQFPRRVASKKFQSTRKLGWSVVRPSEVLKLPAFEITRIRDEGCSVLSGSSHFRYLSLLACYLVYL